MCHPAPFSLHFLQVPQGPAVRLATVDLPGVVHGNLPRQAGGDACPRPWRVPSEGRSDMAPRDHSPEPRVRQHPLAGDGAHRTLMAPCPGTLHASHLIQPLFGRFLLRCVPSLPVRCAECVLPCPLGNLKVEAFGHPCTVLDRLSGPGKDAQHPGAGPGPALRDHRDPEDPDEQQDGAASFGEPGHRRLKNAMQLAQGRRCPHLCAPPDHRTEAQKPSLQPHDVL